MQLANLTKANMSPRLKISSFVVERLKKLEDNTSGQLYGTDDGAIIYVVGISVGSNDSEENKELVSHFSADFDLCGAFKVTNNESPANIVSHEFLDTIKKKPVVLTISNTSKEIITYVFEKASPKKLENTVVDGNEILKSFLHFHLKATVLVSCDFQSEHVQESISFFQQKIDNGNAGFQIEESNVYILGNTSDDVSGISSELTVDELFNAVKSGEKKSDNGIPIINVSMYLKGTNNETIPQLAPVIKYVKKAYKHASIELPIDGLAAVPRHLKIKNLYQILVESLSRSFALKEKSLVEQLKNNGIKDVSIPETYHFFPEGCGHFFSIVYPSKQSIDQLKKEREKYHTLLNLPMDKPIFRPGNAYNFSNFNLSVSSNILLNPHEGLSPSGVPDGDPWFVQGTYAYHHYMQDNFDDNGWGCAYRSLQTICSWFRYQGYTNNPVPTHNEIQQCLVRIGDKPSSFIGSRHWIGSTEVSFVLDTLLGVTCRIVSVSSGEEMTMKGGELSYHFKTQGTPIMIGGGVLAHTIIGVDYNKKTGAMKFLILDPHYTGQEDLKTIQSKGWCGWKGPEFWKKDAFYNMCLPLRPKCV